MSERVGLTLVQLHGDEGPAFCAEVNRRTGARVIKAKAVGDRGDVQALDVYRDVDYHLIDARVPGMRGGTGQTVDLELVKARKSPIPLILAGGLNAQNVAEAARAVHPFAVDTASGTEAEPGVSWSPRPGARSLSVVGAHSDARSRRRRDPSSRDRQSRSAGTV